MAETVQEKKTGLKKNIRKRSFSYRLKRDIIQNRELYILALPILLFYILFHYKPMYGTIIAFKNFTPAKGIMNSPWAGLQHFKNFFSSVYFGRVLKNTLIISITQLIFGFPAPILLALLINELRNRAFSRTVQTIGYMPHFISLVVLCGMIKQFTSDSGFITLLLSHVGLKKQTMLNQPGLFVPIYVISDIWQNVGWGSIIYLAALTGIDPELYDASKIDGAGRWKQTLYITIPCLLPTIIILLILRTGSILSVGSEKIILLYNPSIYETSDVISSYVYRQGLLNSDWSYSTAVGLFNSVVNFALVVMVNKISRKTSEISLW
jgi:putative aldouronate transport system permease protein